MATSPEIEEKNIKGQYFVPFAVGKVPTGVASQEEAPLELWNFTENLLKEKVADYKGAPI